MPQPYTQAKASQPPSSAQTNHQTITFDIPFGSRSTSANKTSPAGAR
jgi:hypothetical protein